MGKQTHKIVAGVLTLLLACLGQLTFAGTEVSAKDAVTLNATAIKGWIVGKTGHLHRM